VRQLTRETCDVLARVDLTGAIRSLNVSNAAALALYVARSKL
jgi:23S rRNA (guanosine2251-2'-O)-methyltransferase